MRITRRPAMPVVFLLLAGIGWAGEVPDLEPVERLAQEIQRWRRIRRPEDDKAFEAFQQAYAAATAAWVRRWPGEELAWRERLRALIRGPGAAEEVERALVGAEKALGGRPGLRFPEDTRFLMAEAAVVRGVRLEQVADWLNAAQASVASGLPSGSHPLEQAYRRERLSEARWRAAEILADWAFRRRNAEELEAQLHALAAETAMPAPDPADRLAVAEQARRRTKLLTRRGRLAQLRGDVEAARAFYRRAVAARPALPGAAEMLEHRDLLAEAKDLGVAAGPGTPIPPATSAGPHWLATEQFLEGFVPDGRPAVAVVWDGEGEGIRRASERLRRQDAVRILECPHAKAEWVRRYNPLYTAPQLWVVDAQGVIRLVGRMQPGGDGWEDAVAGAALRLGRR